MKEDIKICEYEGERFEFDLTKAEGRIHYLIHLYGRWETSLDYREVFESQGVLDDGTRKDWDDSLETGYRNITRKLEAFGLTESDLYLHMAYSEMKGFGVIDEDPQDLSCVAWRRRIERATGVDPEDAFRYEPMRVE